MKDSTGLGLTVVAVLACAAAPLSRAQTLQVQLYSGVIVTGVVNVPYALQATTNLAVTNGWVTLTNFNLPANPWLFLDYDSPQFGKRFYRTVALPVAGTTFLAPGSFAMGDTFSEGNLDERPVHTVNLSPFFVEHFEVTKGYGTWSISGPRTTATASPTRDLERQPIIRRKRSPGMMR